MRSLAASGSFHVALLDGVTGSGKTEVYFEAIAENIRRGRQIADPDAGDRADRPVPRPFCAAFWRASAGMAFRTDSAHPRPQLGGDFGRRSAGRRRGALGAVSALRQSRSDHRRRGARPGLQAGRGRALSCPRHGGGARAYRQNPDRAGLRNALDRDRGQCAQGPLPAHRAAVALRRPAHAADRGDRLAPGAAGARPFHFAAARRADPVRDRAARAGAVVPQSPRLCAADIVPRLRASFCLHHLRRLAGRSPFSPAAGLPPLRFLDAAAAYLPALRGRGIAGRGRPGRGAPAGRGGCDVPQARAPWCCRATSSPRSRPCAAN